jgi:hypothetical protein
MITALKMHEGRLLAGRAGRLQVYDAERPDQPLAESEDLGGEIVAIELRASRAYVATSRPAALWSLDLSDPARVQSLGRIDLSQGLRRFSVGVVGMVLVGDFLYVAPQFGLRVFGFDEAGRALPLTERMSTANGRALLQVDDRLLMTLAEIQMLGFDLADPLLGQGRPFQELAEGESLALAASPDGRLLYGLNTGFSGGQGRLWLDVYDRLALDRGDWGLLHRQIVDGLGWTHAGKLRLLGDRLYLLASGENQQSGEMDRHLLARFALDDPAVPLAGARLWLGEAPRDLVAVEAGDGLLLALGLDGLVRVAAPAAGGLSLEQRWPSPRPDRGLAADAGLALVATGDGLMSLDLSRPEQPRPLGVFSPAQFGPPVAERVAGLRLSGNRAYLLYRLEGSAPGRRGLAVVDLSDPRHPRELGFFETPRDVVGVEVWDERAVLWDAAGLRLIDLSRPEGPRELGAYRAAGSIRALAWRQDIAYLAVSDGLNEGMIEMVDWSDGSRPARIGVLEERFGRSGPGDAARALLLSPGQLFVASAGELASLDLSDPRRPRLEVRRFIDEDTVRGLSWQAPYLYFGTVRTGFDDFLGAFVETPMSIILDASPAAGLRILDQFYALGPPVRAGALDLAEGAAGELLVLQPLAPPQVFLPALLGRASFEDGDAFEGNSGGD